MIHAPGPIVFVDDVSSVEGTELDAPALHHLSTVLRLRDGDRFVLADGRGSWCPVAWGASIRAAGDVVEEPPPPWPITVGFAPAKGDRPEWAVQKMVECGVDVIVPVMAERSVVRWTGERAERVVSKLGRIALEAAAQSRRSWLAEVRPVVELATVRGDEGAMLADPDGELPTADLRFALVGPEGGWSPDELAGASRVRLSANVLRAETAAVVAACLMSSLRDGVVAARSGA